MPTNVTQDFFPSFLEPWKPNSPTDEILSAIKTRIIADVVISIADEITPYYQKHRTSELAESYFHMIADKYGLEKSEVASSTLDYYSKEGYFSEKNLNTLDLRIADYFSASRFSNYLYDEINEHLDSLLENPENSEEMKLKSVDAYLKSFGDDDTWDIELIRHYQRQEVTASLVRRLVQSGKLNIESAVKSEVGDGITLYQFDNSQNSALYIENTKDHKSKSLLGSIYSGDNLKLDSFVTDRQKAMSLLSKVPKKAREKFVTEMIPQTLFANSTETQSQYHAILSMLPKDTKFKLDKTEDFTQELEKDAALANTFFAAPKEEKHNTPTPNDPDEIQSFLASPDGATYRTTVKKTLGELKQWAETHDTPIDTKNIDRVERLMCSYAGNNSAVNKVKFPLYYEGIHHLEAIVDSLKNTDVVPLQMQKTFVQELVDIGFKVCEPGVNKNAYLTKNKLSGNISDILIDVKRELATQVVQEILIEKHIVEQVKNAGYDTHIENSILNYFAHEIGLRIEDDEEYSLPLELDKRITPDTLLTIKYRLQQTLTFEKTLDYLLDKHIQTVFDNLKGIDDATSTNKFENIETFLDLFGEDHEFSCYQLVALDNDGNMTVQPENDIKAVITISLANRFIQSGWANYNKLALDDTFEIYTPNTQDGSLQTDRNTDKIFVLDKREMPPIRLPIALFLKEAAGKENMADELKLIANILNTAKKPYPADLIRIIEKIPKVEQEKLADALVIPPEWNTISSSNSSFYNIYLNICSPDKFKTFLNENIKAGDDSQLWIFSSQIFPELTNDNTKIFVEHIQKIFAGKDLHETMEKISDSRQIYDDVKPKIICEILLNQFQNDLIANLKEFKKEFQPYYFTKEPVYKEKLHELFKKISPDDALSLLAASNMTDKVVVPWIKEVAQKKTLGNFLDVIKFCKSNLPEFIELAHISVKKIATHIHSRSDLLSLADTIHEASKEEKTLAENNESINPLMSVQMVEGIVRKALNDSLTERSNAINTYFNTIEDKRDIDRDFTSYGDEDDTPGHSKMQILDDLRVIISQMLQDKNQPTNEATILLYLSTDLKRGDASADEIKFHHLTKLLALTLNEINNKTLISPSLSEDFYKGEDDDPNVVIQDSIQKAVAQWAKTTLTPSKKAMQFSLGAKDDINSKQNDTEKEQQPAAPQRRGSI